MPKSLHSFLPLAVALTVFIAPHAKANCAMPVGYMVDVAGSTVTVVPNDFDERTCPDKSGMLRENVDTGEVVKLSDFCSSAAEDGSRSSGYIDECVPRGSYRYGFAEPYECNAASCGTYYFGKAEVTAELDEGCVRSEGNAEPTSVPKAPWGSDNVICSYGGDSDKSGCSISMPSGSSAVFAINLAALLLGLVLCRRRDGGASS
ncbi:MAG: hypothetical protein QM784_17740 [Polyangiaceae bacterium]